MCTQSKVRKPNRGENRAIKNRAKSFHCPRIVPLIRSGLRSHFCSARSISKVIGCVVHASEQKNDVESLEKVRAKATRISISRTIYYLRFSPLSLPCSHVSVISPLFPPVEYYSGELTFWRKSHTIPFPRLSLSPSRARELSVRYPGKFFASGVFLGETQFTNSVR